MIAVTTILFTIWTLKNVFLPSIKQWSSLLFQGQIAPPCFKGYPHPFFICFVQDCCACSAVSLYRVPCWKESRGWNLANAFLPSVPSAQKCAYLEKVTLSNLHQNAIQDSHSSASRFWGGEGILFHQLFLSLWQGHVSWFSRSFPPTYKNAFVQKPQQKIRVFLAFCHVPSPYRLWAHTCILKSEMIL